MTASGTSAIESGWSFATSTTRRPAPTNTRLALGQQKLGAGEIGRNQGQGRMVLARLHVTVLRLKLRPTAPMLCPIATELAWLLSSPAGHR